jgi:DnaJ domain
MEINRFAIFLFFSFSVAYADQGKQPKIKTVTQHLVGWWRIQERRGYHTKLQRDSVTTVNSIVHVNNLSEADRKRGKEILLALSKEAKKGRQEYDVRKALQESDNPQALLDILNAVYKNKPVVLDTHSFRTMQELDVLAQKFAAGSQLLKTLYELSDDDRASIIHRAHQLHQADLAKIIEGIGRLSQQQIADELFQMHNGLSRVKSLLQHLKQAYAERMNTQYALWFATCAQALDSKTLPSAQEIGMHKNIQKQLKEMHNRLDQLHIYDAQTQNYFWAIGRIIGMKQDCIAKLFELKQGLEYLGADDERTDGEICKAYRTASLKCHPDKHGGSTEKFQQLGKAKEFKRKNPNIRIKDVEKRIASHKAVIQSLQRHRKVTIRYFPREREALAQAIFTRTQVQPLHMHYPPQIPMYVS